MGIHLYIFRSLYRGFPQPFLAEMLTKGGQGGVEIRVGLTHLGDVVHRIHGR